MIPGGGMDRKENEKWRRKADCMFEVTAAAGGGEEEDVALGEWKGSRITSSLLVLSSYFLLYF